MRPPPEVVAATLTGTLSGVAGGLLFATLHAMIIVPIWTRMTSGLLFGAIAGAGAGWAFAEFYPEAVRTRTRRSATVGARFGATLWLVVAPVTAADAFLRAVGIAPRYELFAVGVALTLAVAGGATLGWVITNRVRGAVAGAVAALLLVFAMAGPVPVGRSMRAFNIFLAVLPVALLGGTALGLFSPSIFALITRGRPPGERAPAS
ncbi:MAG: hypothetical protein WD802_06275 [Gemmatimonadaceae bacterium]